jgi:tetratricopeptide (TPR) repeat protein
LPQAIALHLENAKAKLAANACDEAKQEAEAVLGLDSKNKKAPAIIKRCEALAAAPPEAAVPVAAAPVPPPEPKPVVRKPAVVAAARPAPAAKPRAAEPPKPEPAAPAADPDKLIKDAQQAWFRGQYSLAIDSARKALRMKPSLTNAYQIIAVCSCALHDAESAARAFEKLDDRNKMYVKSACQKNGIAF